MFCAIATTIERCKMEGVVNVFQVVKALRVQKPGAVLNVVSMQHRWSHVHWHSGNIESELQHSYAYSVLYLLHGCHCYWTVSLTLRCLQHLQPGNETIQL